MIIWFLGEFLVGERAVILDPVAINAGMPGCDGPLAAGDDRLLPTVPGLWKATIAQVEGRRLLCIYFDGLRPAERASLPIRKLAPIRASASAMAFLDVPVAMELGRLQSAIQETIHSD